METLLNSACSVVTDRTIMFIRLLTGLYFKVSPNRSIQLAARVYCILCTALCVKIYLTIFLSLYKFDITAVISIISLTIMYIINTIVNFVYDGENYFLFKSELKRMDLMLNLKSVERITCSKLLFAIMLIAKLINVMYIFAAKGFSISEVWYATAAIAIPLSVSTSNITKIMMFESLNYRMKILRKHFERVLSVARRFEDGEDIIRENLYKCMNIYKNLLHTVELADKPMKFMMFLTTVAVIPCSLIFTYKLINSSLFQYPIFVILETFLSLVISFVPGIFVEFINSEISKIRLRVVAQLLVYKDTKARDAVVNAVKYFDCRPFKYTIWRVVTIDLNLLLTMFGLVTTSTIAMIQFTHIYD